MGIRPRGAAAPAAVPWGAARGCVTPAPPAPAGRTAGEAAPPSEFVERQLNAGDSMEIVKVTAGG